MIAHQYRLAVSNAAPLAAQQQHYNHANDGTYTDNNNASLVATFGDIVGYSCLNGWSCGNIANTVLDVVEWYATARYL